MVAIQQTIGTPDLLQRMRDPVSAIRIMRDAKNHRRNTTAFLETLSPTDDADKSGLDAFGRLMREADVVTRSIPEEGIYADTYEDFLERAGRPLFTEWAWRQYRRAQATMQGRGVQVIEQGGQRLVQTSLDSLVGTIFRPYADIPGVVQDEFQPAVPISEVLAGNRGITGASARGAYLVEPTAAQKRLVRVGEAADIPKVTIRLTEHTRDLYKFGRGVEMTYELLRREPIDRIQPLIQLISVQNETDKLAAIIDVLVNGDGNSGTAADVHDLTTLDADATVAGGLTLKAWLAFRGKFVNPYVMTHALAREGVALDLRLLNTGSANLPITTLPLNLLGTELVPVNTTLSGGVRLGVTDDAPADKIIGLDRRVAVERIFEIGSEIEETERYASNQTEVLFFTENETYMVRNQNGAKILDLTA